LNLTGTDVFKQQRALRFHHFVSVLRQQFCHSRGYTIQHQHLCMQFHKNIDRQMQQIPIVSMFLNPHSTISFSPPLQREIDHLQPAARPGLEFQENKIA